MVSLLSNADVSFSFTFSFTSFSKGNAFRKASGAITVESDCRDESANKESPEGQETGRGEISGLRYRSELMSQWAEEERREGDGGGYASGVESMEEEEEEEIEELSVAEGGGGGGGGVKVCPDDSGRFPRPNP